METVDQLYAVMLYVVGPLVVASCVLMLVDMARTIRRRGDLAHDWQASLSDATMLWCSRCHRTIATERLPFVTACDHRYGCGIVGCTH